MRCDNCDATLYNFKQHKLDDCVEELRDRIVGMDYKIQRLQNDHEELLVKLAELREDICRKQG